MEIPNFEKGQATKYFYYLLAIVAFVIIVAGISGAFVPEDSLDETQATESTVKPVTSRGQEVSLN